MRPSSYRRIDAGAARALLEQRDVAIFDVRDQQSFVKGHIDGARHLTIMKLENVIKTTARDALIMIYCHHGFASREYAATFCDFGFQDVYSLDGGYEGWLREGDRCAAGRSASLAAASRKMLQPAS